MFKVRIKSRHIAEVQAMLNVVERRVVGARTSLHTVGDQIWTYIGVDGADWWSPTAHLFKFPPDEQGFRNEMAQLRLWLEVHYDVKT